MVTRFQYNLNLNQIKMLKITQIPVTKLGCRNETNLVN